MAEEFFTPEEVAAKLKLSKYTIYEMIKRGDLEAHRIGRGLRISSQQLEGYLHQHKTDEDNVFDAQLVQSEQGTYARLLHCEPEVLFHVSTPLTGAVRVSIEPENIIISPKLFNFFFTLNKIHIRRNFLIHNSSLSFLLK